MGARVLLVALILWGPIGSIVCSLHCTEFELPASKRVAAAPGPAGSAPGTSHCHGHEDPAPAWSSPEPGSLDPGCCGAHLALDHMAPKLSDDRSTMAFVSLVSSEDALSRRTPIAAPAAHALGRLESPYSHQNPPLLS